MRMILMVTVPLFKVRARVALLVLFFLGTAHAPAIASQPEVVAVDGTLCNLSSILAGSSANITCLIPPGGNPHGYQLKPSDRRVLANASLVVHNGFDLTPAVKKLTTSAPVIAVGEVALSNYQGNDPHVWHDPIVSAGMIRIISKELSKILSEDERSGLILRTNQAIDVFNDLGQWGADQFSGLPEDRRVIATDHRTYSHMAARFGFRELAMMDSHTTGGVLRPSSLNNISDDIQISGAQVIFKPTWDASKTLKRISKRSGIPISSTPLNGEGIAAGETAISTAIQNVCVMVNGQGGECDRLKAKRLAERWDAIQ